LVLVAPLSSVWIVAAGADTWFGVKISVFKARSISNVELTWENNHADVNAGTDASSANL
jgi:hypothetical protein